MDCLAQESHSRFLDTDQEEESSAGIATGYRLDGRVGSRFLCSPRRQDRLYSPPSLLSSGKRSKAAGE
jgi:hypothetical protein